LTEASLKAPLAPAQAVSNSFPSHNTFSIIHFNRLKDLSPASIQALFQNIKDEKVNNQTRPLSNFFEEAVIQTLYLFMEDEAEGYTDWKHFREFPNQAASMSRQPLRL
jgi:hypothetical protein